jgi:UDP-glucose 4-epimerase
MTTACVTGASGWIGRTVCRELAQHDGVAVVAIGRRRLPGVAADGFVEADLSGDIAGSAALRRALQGDVVVVHCAGHAHRPLETEAERQRFFAVNRDGTERLVRLAEALDVRRFVHVSTVGFYDWSQSQPVAEDGAVRAASAYERSKLEGERVVRASALDWRVVRLATVFGAGDHANFLRLARALRRGRFPLPGRGAARKSVVPIDLAARCLARLALGEPAPHRLINLALPQAPSLAEITDAFHRVCGFRRPWRLPDPALRAAGRVGDALAQCGLHLPMSTETLTKLTTPTVVDVRRMREIFPDVEWPTFDVALAGHRDWYREAA